ncbi:MAG: S41 family peptidase [Pelolinea sp.]|nr:S41 family peptidase [Pelolinea sp.]
MSTPLVFQKEENDLNSLFKPFNQAWEIVHDLYLDQPVDDIKMMQGAIRGMMDSLGDPYSSYLDPDEFKEQNYPIEGEYTGIGAWVDTSGDLLVIISPMPNSPAEKVGLEPGDEVIKIDNQTVTDLDPTLVLKKILGPADTKILITIRRQETELIDFEITRAIIAIPSVETKLIDGQIGYIRLYTFGVNSYDEFKQALSQLIDEGAQYIIFDLRNNTGGLVDSAIDISSIFLEDKVILIEEWGDGTTKQYKTIEDAISVDIPLYVLVNEGSASASEIAIGAFQDHERAVIIGKTTFGKGLIQNWIPLEGENGAVRISIAHWLTPNGRLIQNQGLTPDIEVDFTEEDFNAGIDPQLQSAIDKINEIDNP